MTTDAKPRARRRLVEQLRRRADFDPDAGFSSPVRLADGREWHLARPWLQVVPRFRGGRVVGRDDYLTCGDDFDAVIRALAEGLDGPDFVVAVMTLGATLLLRNYDLDDEELARLFTFRPGDPASAAMLQDIVDVATGGARRVFGGGAVRDPKSSAAG